MKYLPMLCKKGTKELLRSKDYIFEPKLDGTRCIAEINEEVNLFNRREKNIRKRYPFICQELKKYKGMVFDGEIVCYNKEGIPDFYLLQKREHIDNEFIIEIKAKLIPATYVIFDILEIDGKSLIEKPLEERKEILNDLFEKSAHLELIFSTPNGEALWKEIIKRDMEGVIAKKLGSKYYPGERRKEWLKIKNTKTIDVVIVGYTQEIREISALAMALWKDSKLYYIGKVGTGFDEELMNYMLKKFEKVDSPPVVNPENAPENVIWVKPKFVAEVEYLEITKDNELRAPAFKRLREDKSVDECTFEQVE